MRNITHSIVVCLLLLFSCQGNNKTEQITTSLPPSVAGKGDVEMWFTSANKQNLLVKANVNISFQSQVGNGAVIEVDTATTYQTMDGFGYTLTGGSAYVMNQQLDQSQRENLLKELFSQDGIGVSYLRVSIGASDLDVKVFSYNDLPSGQTDVTLEKFSLQPDKANLIPILKQILAINPNIKLMGSPWSPPAWMKTNGKTIGGSLKPEYYSVYAQYLVRYIQEMQKEGIPIDAITIQNEPENPHNNPSLLMTATEQADFIKNHLGLAFEKAGIKTKIVIFDHNCDHPNYPISILDDPAAKKYIDGTAFHLYAGDISALSKVQQAHPDKHLYFTEQWTSSAGEFGGDLLWHTKNLIIGAPRNWSKTVLEWNLAADARQKPYTDGGCTQCLGALTIDNHVITRNVPYYVIAQVAKFVPSGAKRIASNQVEGLSNVTFLNPNGKKVLVILNESEQAKNINIKANQKIATVSIPSKSVATLVW